MPATSTFPERRTRSQLTLPDTVLAIPEKSPLKIAKSRNTMAERDAVVEDSEDDGGELVLSPRRRKTTTPPVAAEAAKRSASPSMGDEYAVGSADGRDLKRRKRDEGGSGKDAVDTNSEGSGLVSTDTEPRRSTRQKYTPSNRKPVSTVSASPPPTAAHSPAPVSGRAQSVPLFASADDLPRTDLPRLDLTKMLRSPKRKRSRSRSPVKDNELRLRMTNVNVAAIPVFRLPTIHAGIATGSGSGSGLGSLSDGETSVPEEQEMEIPVVPQSSSPPSSPPATGLRAAADISKDSVPATPAASAMALDKTMPMSPLTPVPPTPFPPIRKPAAYTRSRLGMQVGGDDTVDTERMEDVASGVGAASSSVTPHVQAHGSSSARAAVASSSRLPALLPRPSMASPASAAVPVPSTSNGRSSGFGMGSGSGLGSGSGQPPGPNLNFNGNNNNNFNFNLNNNKRNTALPSSSSLPALTTLKTLPALKPKPKMKGTNVFDMLMASSKAKGKEKEKAVEASAGSGSGSGFSGSGAGPSFAPVMSRQSADSSKTGTKLKLKDRMRGKDETTRKKERAQAEKAREAVIVALPEEEEEEEREARRQEEEEDEEEEMSTPTAEGETLEERAGSIAVQRQEHEHEHEHEQDKPDHDVPFALAGPPVVAEASDERLPEVVEGAQDVVMEEAVPQAPQVVDTITMVEDVFVLDGARADSNPTEGPQEEVEEQSEVVMGGDGEEMETAAFGSVVEECSTAAENMESPPTSEEKRLEVTPSEPVADKMNMEEESHESHTDNVEDVAMGQPAVEAQAEAEATADESQQPIAGAEAVEEEHEEDGVAEDQDLDAPPTKQSKTSLGKKRVPSAGATALPLPARVTRSSSTRKQGVEVTQPALAGPSRKQPRPTFKAPLKRTASGKVKAPVLAASSSSTFTTTSTSTRPRTPGSPMKISTPKKAAPALTKDGAVRGETYAGGARSTANTPVAKRGRGSPSPRRPASSPSPTKVSRALPEYTPIRPSGLTRAFSTSQIFTRPGSSLSQLSNALQKLHQPAPARSSTSMGFNPDAGDDTDNDNDTLTTKDDAAIGQRKSIGLGRAGSSASQQRSATLSSDAFRSAASSSSTTTATTTTTVAGSSFLTRPTASSQAKLVQKKLPFGPNKTAGGPPKFGMAMAAARGRPVGGVSKVKPLFGVGGGLRRTASKKSSLPVVIGSPVKGGSTSDVVGEGAAGGMGIGEEEEEDEDAGGEIFNTILNTGVSATTLLANLLAQEPAKGEERDGGSRKPPSHSRRVSMLSRDLLVAATAPPPPPPPSSSSQTAAAAGPSGSGSGGKGLMGPPPTPPSIASVKSTSDSGSPSSGAAKRSSARIAKTTAAAAAAAAVESTVAAGKKRAMDPPPVPNPAAEALHVLNECVIFVDVKTDDGDEAGTLFVDMLGTLGARVAAGVGQRCTHIVFKNGLSSTTNKYRALRDPKPHVVSIGWVVACAEQRRHVPEAEYLVDLEFANILGANKRRRASVYHKLLTDSAPDYAESAEKDKEDGTDEGDRSMDGSVSSITMEDDGLAPLERARRRKSMMIGLNH